MVVAGRIVRLSAELANQIAAGEVVERPASVVKELVENSLDAGATRVKVEIERGGLDLLRVSDDGEGMSAADAELALERHATSKIATITDLNVIRTFGFRGEALPSIASVSRLTLCTRRVDDDAATEVVALAGGEIRATPASRATGSTVEVRDLFFNVPARRKFLKSQATESAHVGEVVLWAALSRPEVSFSLVREGKLSRELLRASSRRERAQMAIGEPTLIACEGARGPLRIEAHLAPPERARSGAVALYVFVNGRPVRDRLLARAISQGYGSVLEPGRYPVGVVYIDLPPDLVDVNVHPQKAEVRFQDARAVFDAVSRELFEALSKSLSIPASGPPTRPWMTPRPSPVSAPAPADAPLAARSGADAPAPAPAPYAPAAASDGPSTAWLRELSRSQPTQEPYVAAPAGPALFASTTGFYAGLRYLAQVKSTYLVCEGEDGLYLIDQHAADERVTFDALRKAHAKAELSMQRLLIAEIVQLAAGEVSLFTEHEAEVARLGLDVRAAGASAVAVHAVPHLLARASPERLVRDVLLELSRQATRPFSAASDLVLATMACHGSVRAGDSLGHEQAQALLASLDGVDFSGHCPHGRPVITRLSYADLERRVGR